MSTIKSFTDIPQSKKLAEILPLESADMCCFENQDGSCNYYGFPYTQAYKAANPIPLWSLSVLLELLPKRLEIVDNVYELSIYFYGLYYWNVNNGNLFFESKDKDNLVDACYEMILKLNELKML